MSRITRTMLIRMIMKSITRNLSWKYFFSRILAHPLKKKLFSYFYAIDVNFAENLKQKKGKDDDFRNLQSEGDLSNVGNVVYGGKVFEEEAGKNQHCISDDHDEQEKFKGLVRHKRAQTSAEANFPMKRSLINK